MPISVANGPACSQRSAHASRQMLSPLVCQAPSRAHQEHPPITPPVSQIARATESQYQVIANCTSQPSQASAATPGGERASAADNQLDTLSVQLDDAPHFELKPVQDVTTPPVAADIVTPNHTENDETRKAVGHTAKRQKIDGGTTQVTANQSYPPPTIDTCQSSATPREINAPQSHLPTPTKRISRSATLGIGLGAGPQRFGLEGRMVPTELPVTVAIKASVKKRKRTASKEKGEELVSKSESGFTGSVWRPSLGRTEIVTHCGWVAYRRVKS